MIEAARDPRAAHTLDLVQMQSRRRSDYSRQPSLGDLFECRFDLKRWIATIK
jgi:hypothetical protein